MRRTLIAAAALAVVASGAVSARERDRPLAANPSGFIAAEIAFARLAQEKGQWTAFRETAAPEAVMFVPQRVKARDWLKSQKDPAEAVKWQAHAVYVSCDGNVGVTTGAWQKGLAARLFHDRLAARSQEGQDGLGPRSWRRAGDAARSPRFHRVETGEMRLAARRRGGHAAKRARIVRWACRPTRP